MNSIKTNYTINCIVCFLEYILVNNNKIGHN
ncbi:MAG: hypothetical protein TIS_03435 [Tissierella sp.]